MMQISKIEKKSSSVGIPKMWGKNWEYHFDYWQISPHILEMSPTHGLYM
jgi:hypothetical protein